MGEIRAPNGECNGALVCGVKSVGKLNVGCGFGMTGTEGDGGLGIVPSDDTGESDLATDAGRYGDLLGDNPLFDLGEPAFELAGDGEPIFEHGDDRIGESDDIVELTGVGESRLITRGLQELVLEGAGCGVLGPSSSSSLSNVKSITSILGFFSAEAPTGGKNISISRGTKLLQHFISFVIQSVQKY